LKKFFRLMSICGSVEEAKAISNNWLKTECCKTIDKQFPCITLTSSLHPIAHQNKKRKLSTDTRNKITIIALHVYLYIASNIASKSCCAILLICCGSGCQVVQDCARSNLQIANLSVHCFKVQLLHFIDLLLFHLSRWHKILHGHWKPPNISSIRNNNPCKQL
jgi:hypothetical protein